MNDSSGFDLDLRTRVVCSIGGIARLGELAAGIFDDAREKRVLLVTDPGVAAVGHARSGEETLLEAGFRVQRFEDVRENPTTSDVDACLALAKDFEPQLLVGFGGGSSMDVAKGTNFLYSCGGRMQDYRGVGKAGREMLPLIAVPTTAGTGSEALSFALIVDEQTHEKMACGDPRAAPRLALLDPQLTLTLPPLVTACTGLDAIGHAVETAVTKKRNAVSSMFSREAFRFLSRAFPRVVKAPDDLEARADMLRGAALAGFAIENSMLGAAHSMANPLTKHFGLPHGQAVGTVLPHVVAFNRKDPTSSRIYSELATFVGGAGPRALIEALRGFVAQAGFPLALGECGVDPRATDLMAAEAAEQWTAQHNPRRVEGGEFTALFAAAYDGGSI